MNRSLMVFLTMFSLVLLLGVYYLSLPNEDMKVASVDATPKEFKKANSLESLQEQINQKHLIAIKKCEEKIASNKVSKEEKNHALYEIEAIKKLADQEKKLVKSLKDQGYDSAIEIVDQSVSIALFNQKDDKQVAKDVMDIVNKECNNAYYLEVSFK